MSQDEGLHYSNLCGNEGNCTVYNGDCLNMSAVRVIYAEVYISALQPTSFMQGIVTSYVWITGIYMQR